MPEVMKTDRLSLLRIAHRTFTFGLQRDLNIFEPNTRFAGMANVKQFETNSHGKAAKGFMI
jgi:hypothetical protein